MGGSGGEGGGGATAEAEARVEAGGARGGGRARRGSRRHEVELEKRIALLQDLERRLLACGVCGVRGVYVHITVRLDQSQSLPHCSAAGSSWPILTLYSLVFFQVCCRSAGISASCNMLLLLLLLLEGVVLQAGLLLLSLFTYLLVGADLDESGPRL